MTDTITSLEQLEALYGPANPMSLLKETRTLTPDYRSMVEASPFCAVATVGRTGMDCSPRGDPIGCVRVLDDATVAFADRRGNNRLDTLRNLIGDPRIALLFLIPGVNETLRINGRAIVSIAPSLLHAFAIGDKAPQSVVVVSIDAVYFQCARALLRSELWNASRLVDRKTLPTAGQMTRAAAPAFDADSYDLALPERQASSLY